MQEVCLKWSILYLCFAKLSSIKEISPHPPSASYVCPNEIRCGKRFKSQEEFLEHLKPRIFTLESLSSFPAPDRRNKDSRCLYCAKSLPRSAQAVFDQGVELQKTLTNSSNGLASCVAEMVYRGDLDVGGWGLCSSCSNHP
jgi:hypothetical protein